MPQAAMIKNNKYKKKRFKAFITNRPAVILLLIFGVILGIFFPKLMMNEQELQVGNSVNNRNKEENLNKVDSQEIGHILSLRKVKDQKPHLLKLLGRIGPERAQEELVGSGLPFTGETHLLMHTVGEYIYNKFGSEGLGMCKDYFLSACFHAFIIEDLSDHGLEGLAKTVDRCENTGRHVLSQCSHASGHGFVVWNDYDLVKALSMCDKLGEISKNLPLVNCYDGVFMENIFSVHEGKLSTKRWVNNEDPYYPCNDPRIPEKYLVGCWTNQASLMYQIYKGDFRKVAEGCDRVLDTGYQELCYNNFARQIHSNTDGRSDRAFELCKKATGMRWHNYCLTVLVGASFSVGDRTKMPFEICYGIDALEKNNCYNKLYGLINWYIKDEEDAVSHCKNILDREYIKNCEKYQQKIGRN
jgi:hypothetical protein